LRLCFLLEEIMNSMRSAYDPKKTLLGKNCRQGTIKNSSSNNNNDTE